MNHVQKLHSRVMQNLHSPGVQDLPAGGLDAKIAFRPAGKTCLLARVN